PHAQLHSYPTRRSSDLKARRGDEGRPYGGLLTATRSGIPAAQLSSSDHVLHIKLTKMDVSLLSCYFPPDTEIEDIVEEINASLRSEEHTSELQSRFDLV